MPNAVDYVRKICKERNLPVSSVERACGFSNGYLNPKKLQKIPYDRATVLSSYLNIPIEPLLGEPETKKAPTFRERVESELDEYSVSFLELAKDLSDENKEKLLELARLFKLDQERKQRG